MKTAPLEVQDILTMKQERLAARKTQTPMNALRALAGMQRRPEPVLSMITDTVMIFGHVAYSPLNYDPVQAAVSYAQAGLDAVCMFTDDTIYEGSVKDLTLIARAVHIPTINLNYVFDEYQIVESRAAGASALTLYASLMDRQTLRMLLSATARNRMTPIIDVSQAEDLHGSLDFCPPAVGLSKRAPNGELDLHWMHHMRLYVPFCSQVVIATPLRRLDEARAVAALRPRAVLIEPSLLPSLPELRAIFARS
jgi:indole-3-glycerol phosphate synthase